MIYNYKEAVKQSIINFVKGKQTKKALCPLWTQGLWLIKMLDRCF